MQEKPLIETFDVITNILQVTPAATVMLVGAVQKRCQGKAKVSSSGVPVTGILEAMKSARLESTLAFGLAKFRIDFLEMLEGYRPSGCPSYSTPVDCLGDKVFRAVDGLVLSDQLLRRVES